MSLPTLDVMAVLADLQQQLSDLAGVVEAQQRTLQHLLAASPSLPGGALGVAGTETATVGARRTARTATAPRAVPGRAG